MEIAEILHEANLGLSLLQDALSEENNAEANEAIKMVQEAVGKLLNSEFSNTIHSDEVKEALKQTLTSLKSIQQSVTELNSRVDEVEKKLAVKTKVKRVLHKKPVISSTSNSPAQLTKPPTLEDFTGRP